MTNEGFEPTISVSDPTQPSGEASASASGSLSRRPEVHRGSRIGERYEILKLLGRGGMGAVYAAHDHKLDRQVALKLLHSTSEDAQARLVAEAQALARLSDPHVVAVYDAGELDDQIFIAMQLIDGEDLATALRKQPPRKHILDWFCQAGRGLAAAHAAKLVHRDFKPSNVLVDRKGHASVTDFGLARAMSTEDRGLTGMGVMLGTPAYMSPEQHALEPATEASDQFSFCVALWESLFGQHPFIEGDRGSMSPFAIGYHIFDGKLLPPPKGTAVPKRTIDALTRGLSRDAKQRWPSMLELLAELAPAERRPVWPLLVAAGAIAGATVVAVAWLASDDSQASTCQVEARDRAASAWDRTGASKLRDNFAATKRTYAETAVQQATDALDRYASRWTQLQTDVCTAEHAATGTTPDLVVRRRACLDNRLDALRGLVHLFGAEPKSEFVDHALEMARALPELGDCTDAASLLAAPGVPPPDKTADVTKLEAELALAIARGIGGEYQRSKTELTDIAKRADALGWAPTQARAHLALGQRLVAMLQPGREELAKAGELATKHRLDRDAARAWAAMLLAAGWDRKPDVVDAMLPIARSAAARTGDRALEVSADIAYGRALVRLRKLKDANAICRTALAAAQTLDRPTELDLANDCLLETLIPLGAFAEAEPLLVTLVDTKSKQLGADHPIIADYLHVRGTMLLQRGKIAEAKADADRVLAIRKRAFGDKHFKIAEALEDLADVVDADGKHQEAKALYEQALAMAESLETPPVGLIGSLHQTLGYAAQKAGDHEAAVRHFETAVALTRKMVGNDSLELAFLLVNFGQIKAHDNYEAGIGLLGEARAIFEKNHDKRAAFVSGAMAAVEVMHEKWADARRHAEESLEIADANTPPVNIAQMKFIAARAIAETKGDLRRARKLASEARAIYIKLGPSFEPYAKQITEWLAKH